MTSSLPPPAVAQSFWRALVAPMTVRRACRVALIVGTLLVLINQGEHLLAAQFPPVWQIILTYCVPYSVSSYSTAVFIRQLSTSPHLGKEGI